MEGMSDRGSGGSVDSAATSDSDNSSSAIDTITLSHARNAAVTQRENRRRETAACSLFMRWVLVLVSTLALIVSCAAEPPAPSTDDLPPQVRLEYALYTIPSDFPYLWVNVYRVGNLSGGATVVWTTADSSGVAGVDYRHSTGTIRWENGIGGPQQIYVPLLPRRNGPYGRAFSIVLHDNAGVGLGLPSISLVTITDPSPWQLWDDATSTAAGSTTASNPSSNGAIAPQSTDSASTTTAASSATPSTAENATTIDSVATAPPNVTLPTTGGVQNSDTGNTTTALPAASGVGTGAIDSTPTIPAVGTNSTNLSANSTAIPANTTTTATTTPVNTTPVMPSATGAGAGATTPTSGGGGGGGNTLPASDSSLLTQFGSSFAWDSSSYQTDNSNPSVVVGVTRLQVPIPLPPLPSSVQYQTVDGTAVGGTDYVATSGTLNYEANDFQPRIIFIPLRMGNANSSAGASASAGVSVPKMFVVRLSNPNNAFIGLPSAAPITIATVPFHEGKIVLTADAYATPFQAGTATVTVQRLLGSVGAVTVLYNTTNGTARAGTDFTPTNGQLRWAVGDMSDRNISIPLLPTSLARQLSSDSPIANAPNFFLSLTLLSGSKGFLGSPRSAVLFITNQPILHPTATPPAEQPTTPVVVTDPLPAESSSTGTVQPPDGGTEPPPVTQPPIITSLPVVSSSTGGEPQPPPPQPIVKPAAASSTGMNRPPPPPAELSTASRRTFVNSIAIGLFVAAVILF